MPKVARRSRNASARNSPLKRKRDPKASHLYTDDNPATTIHGTGFKDHAAAERTLDLIKERSLTYQFQTINTMYHRAKHHPAMKGGNTGSNADMRDAMDVFKHWLDESYPAAKAELRLGGFKPLLSKQCVEGYLSAIEEANIDCHFARTYANLAKGKRLANTLVDDFKPMQADWERRRYDELCALVPEDGEKTVNWSDEDLWVDGRRDGCPSRYHLQFIAWAWSPVGEKRLHP